MHRVQKLLSNFGHCSRRAAEVLIKDGRVQVNGKTITLGDKASEDDKITVDGKTVKKERKVYLLFNKPVQCVTALKDDQYKTVMEYIKIKERVFPVGRLDYNTTGLLLLTNDGDFANRIMHPSHEVNKSYMVQMDRAMDSQEKRALEKGVKLSDGMTSPARVRLLEGNIVEITIHEGRNRIIRRMLKELEIGVLRLERVKIGKLGLGGLKQGRYRKLSVKEREMIFK